MEKNYFSGIVGGILGGIIFSIPWILVYVYGNMMLSALAIIIGIGILKGYQLFKGKVSKSLPIIIYCIAIAIVLVETLFVIPMIELAKEGYPATIEMLRWAYSISDFTSGLFKDLAFSLLFTVLGVSSVAASVKKQINGDVNQTIKYGGEKNMTGDQEKIKEFFVNNGATNLENSMVVDYSSGLDQNTLFELKDKGIVKTFNGSYYYSLEDEEAYNQQQKQKAQEAKKKNTIIAIVSAVIAVVVVVAIAVIGAFGKGGSSKGTTVNVEGNHSFTLSADYSYEKDDEEDLTYYAYRTKDEELADGYITIIFYNDGGYTLEDDSVNYYEDLFNQYTDVQVTSANKIKTDSGLDGVELVLDVEGTEEDGEAYKYCEIIDLVFTEDENMFFVESYADTLKQVNSLLDGSGILENIK